MVQAITIHFVDPDIKSRAEGARLALALGHHAEVYAGLDEIVRHSPREGMIIARDEAAPGGAVEVLTALPKLGIWLPIVIASTSSSVAAIVSAIHAGAIDFVQLPFDQAQLGATIERAKRYAPAVARARQRMIEAREKLASLSEREREVLDLLLDGASNKVIARELSISPRTVEIHRANMMDKLEANHVADAVRLRFEAYLDWIF